MASMDEISDLSRFCRDFQYLVTCTSRLDFFGCETGMATLKALSRRMHRSTDIPTGGITLAMVRVISRMEVSTTKKSNRLKRGMK